MLADSFVQQSKGLKKPENIHIFCSDTHYSPMQLRAKSQYAQSCWPVVKTLSEEVAWH